MPRTDWIQLHQWYQAVLTAGCNWRIRFRGYLLNPWSSCFLSAEHEAEIETNITESCKHLRRTLLKATETLLRRPGRPLKGLKDCRFLLLLLENPLLYSVRSFGNYEANHVEFKRNDKTTKPGGSKDEIQTLSRSKRGNSRGHTSILKRLLGLMANLPRENHRYIVCWFARYPDHDFKRLVDLIGGFVTHRLMRQRRSCSGIQNQYPTSVLVPEIGGPGAGTSAQLHVALCTRTRPGSPRALDGKITYYDDWQIKAAAKVMSLLFQANSISGLRPHLPTSAFYNTPLDCCDLIADFETWETRQAGFSFCQYPMFLSIWAKIRILEHDARRQMETKARQAFFNSIISRSAVSQYLVLKVRRECLVEDSLRGVSEVVGSGQEDVKKGLRIAFKEKRGLMREGE